MSSPAGSLTRLVIFNDGGESLVQVRSQLGLRGVLDRADEAPIARRLLCAQGVEDEEHSAVLRSYADLVAQVVDAVLAQPLFRHVQAVLAEAPAEVRRGISAQPCRLLPIPPTS
jgi:hypothetical protein